MTTRPALTALLSHWWRNPLQLFTLLVGLALATALWSGVQAINTEARASYGAAASQVSQGQLDQLVPAEGQVLTLQDYVKLRRAGWLVSPQIEGQLDVDGMSVRILGIEPLTAPIVNASSSLQTLPLDRFFSGTGFALIASDMSSAAITLGLDFDVEDSLADGNILVDIAIAAKLLDRKTTFDRFIVLESQPKLQLALSSIAPELRRISAQANTGDIARLTDSFHLNLTAFGLLSFAVGLFIVYGAIGLAFEQRRAMFRTLRALGLSLRSLIALLFAELLIFATLAGLCGVLLGYLIAAALLPDVAATLRGLYGAEVTGTLQIRTSWWASGLGMAVGGTLVASTGTFLRLSRLPLMEAGTPQAWAGASRGVMVGLAFTGMALLTIAAVLSIIATSLIQGFILLGCLLIGTAFLLPWILDQCLAVLERFATNALPSWFWADTRSQVPGLSMALMALMLAIATNVGVSTMVSSFRLTFTGWLDQRLASELYVTLDSAEQADAMRIALQGKVDAILPIVSAPTLLDGQAAKIYAITDHSTYRDHWPLLARTNDAWDQLKTPDAALINEQLARRTGLSVGDKVPGAQGQTIVGIYSDYGNPAPQMMIGLDAFQSEFPNIQPTRFGLRTDPKTIGALTQLLRTELGLPATAIADQARIKALSLGIFEQTFTVTAALNILTLSVAGFSIMMSLLTLAQMRLPQLAPVWALGVTRAQLGRLELIRSVVLAIGVTCLAIPLGLALSWALMAVVNVAAFGWQLPMFVFPLSYLVLSIIAVIAAILATAWPAIRLARTAPHQLLQVFSSGR
ncbi:FtsX-like permease family protein [Planktotalea sp.]|uniref:ABC transporter permease n=1 Tax=Planktotalea sp. TaxID=2029877 RepID=UPI0025D7EF7B|nr:FtsX-like permease family protein [Planktotalea sp.]